jgi:hypothetical protein
VSEARRRSKTRAARCRRSIFNADFSRRIAASAKAFLPLREMMPEIGEALLAQLEQPVADFGLGGQRLLRIDRLIGEPGRLPRIALRICIA